MLFQKLLEASNNVSTPIQYVGGYVQGFVGTTSDVTISLTSLTGGLSSAPAAGDLVIVYFATGSTTDRNLVVANYTSVADLYSNDDYDTNLEVAYKFLDASDTSITLTGGTFSASDAGTVAIQVFRNTNPLSISATTSTGVNGGQPNPPSITPIQAGSIVVAGGASGHTGGTLTFTSSDLTDFITVGSNDTNDSTVGMGYYRWLSGAFDPAQFGGGTTAITASWAAATLSVSPPDTKTRGLIASGSASGSTTANLTRPSLTQVGDLMVVVVKDDTTGIITIPAGWTTQRNLSGGVVATKIATASESSTYAFSNAVAGAINGVILVYRKFDVDVMGSAATSSTNTVSAPSIDASLSGSIVLGVSGVRSLTNYLSTSQSSYFSDNKIATNNRVTVFSKENVSSGATGNIDFSFSYSATNTNTKTAALLSLKPI